MVACVDKKASLKKRRVKDLVEETDNALYCARKKNIEGVWKYVARRKSMLEQQVDLKKPSPGARGITEVLREIVHKDREIRQLLEEYKQEIKGRTMCNGRQKRLRRRFYKNASQPMIIDKKI